MSDFHPGDRILAQWQGGHLWFPGTVHSVGEGGSVAIQYDDGMSEIRPANQVKPLDWGVGALISAMWSGNNQWYAARIVDVEPDGRTLTVRFEDDGIVERTVTGRCRAA
jgi:hypothetical protein